MIASVLLAVALAGGPGPELARTSVPVAANPVSPDERITLKLKDAAVIDILEKCADLLGVTPIFDPGVGGRVSLDVRDLPISKALEMIAKAANVEISVSKKLLRVRVRPGETAPGATRDVAPPKVADARLGEALRFWRDGAGEPPVTIHVPEFVGRVEVPGCAELVTIGRLGHYGGPIKGIALATSEKPGARARGRILGETAADGTRLLLPGCEGKLLVEAGAPLPGATMIEPARIPKGAPLVVTFRLLELTETEESVLSEPRIAFRSDEGFSTKSGFESGAPGGFAQEAEICGLPLEFRDEEDDLLLAVYAGVTRTPATPASGPSLVARRAETFRLRKEQPLRWTVDSSWDGGRAALVLELTFAGRLVVVPK